MKGKTKTQTAIKFSNLFNIILHNEINSNSKKGAVKTLFAEKGNGCDQANLLIALWRFGGIDEKYEHGTSHWWSKYIIDGKKITN